MKEEEKLTVKPGFEKQWEDAVAKNQEDYGHPVVLATAKVGKALDEGKTMKESHDEMYGYDLTGFTAGCVAKWVSSFHPRGEEFRKWWNEDHGVKEENAKGGIVNPALMVINT